MSIYLQQRLLSHGKLSREILLEAFTISLVQKSSLIEALVGMDVRFGLDVTECFQRDGDGADPSWRPDPQLIRDLPPGICDRYLAFPFRERAGNIEVAAISPLEDAVRQEFEVHLRRSVVLYRASVQALLAAAGAAVDMQSLDYHFSEPPPPATEAPIPLIRKPHVTAPLRSRTKTAPGVGRMPSKRSLPFFSGVPRTRRAEHWVSPEASAGLLLAEATSLTDLARILGRLLPAPALVLQLEGGGLVLRASSGPGAYGRERVPLTQPSAFRTAVQEGVFLGAWSRGPIHDRFVSTYSAGTLVRIERIGQGEGSLVAAMAADFDVERAADLILETTEVYRKLSRRE